MSKSIGNTSWQFYVFRSKNRKSHNYENPPFLTASSSVATKFFNANGLEAFSYQVIAASFASYLLTNEIRWRSNRWLTIHTSIDKSTSFFVSCSKSTSSSVRRSKPIRDKRLQWCTHLGFYYLISKEAFTLKCWKLEPTILRKGIRRSEAPTYLNFCRPFSFLFLFLFFLWKKKNSLLPSCKICTT